MRHLITLLAVTTLMLIPKTASAEHGWATIVYEYENHTWHHDYVEAWMGVYDSTMSEIEAARQNLEQNYPHLEVEYVGIDEEESDCTYDFDTQFYHAYSKGTFSFRTRIRPPVTPAPTLMAQLQGMKWNHFRLMKNYQCRTTTSTLTTLTIPVTRAKVRTMVTLLN